MKSMSLLSRFKEIYIDPMEERIEIAKSKIATLDEEQTRTLNLLDKKLKDFYELYHNMLGLIYSHARFVEGVKNYGAELISKGIVDVDGNLQDDFFPSDFKSSFSNMRELLNYYKLKDGEIISEDKSANALLSLSKTLEES